MERPYRFPLDWLSRGGSRNDFIFGWNPSAERELISEIGIGFQLRIEDCYYFSLYTYHLTLFGLVTSQDS